MRRACKAGHLEVPRFEKRGQAQWWLRKEHHLVKSHLLQKLCHLQVSNQTMTNPAQPNLPHHIWGNRELGSMVTDNRCLKFSITHTPRSLALLSWLSIKGTLPLCLSTPAWQVNLCLRLPHLELTQPWPCCRAPQTRCGNQKPQREGSTWVCTGCVLAHAYGLTCAALANSLEMLWGSLLSASVQRWSASKAVQERLP